MYQEYSSRYTRGVMIGSSSETLHAAHSFGFGRGARIDAADSCPGGRAIVGAEGPSSAACVVAAKAHDHREARLPASVVDEWQQGSAGTAWNISAAPTFTDGLVPLGQCRCSDRRHRLAKRDP